MGQPLLFAVTLMITVFVIACPDALVLATPMAVITPDFTSQCQQMLGGWKFANVKDGNLAEYFHVNNAQANLAPIPSGLRDEQAVYCADMLSTGFVAAEHADPHRRHGGRLRPGAGRADGDRGCEADRGRIAAHTLPVPLAV